MIDIYKTWVEDFDIDGFRIDTMKHVDDAFWQQFGPTMQDIAAADGNSDFFMFGEVALDGSDAATKSFTSHYTTVRQDAGDPGLPVPGRRPRVRVEGSRQPASSEQFFANDDWYTDRDSNVYALPTFLGNHDMGRIGYFLKTDNPDADDAELLARDRLAHELMYLSRGNPVVYYGDEQGFAGLGGDQSARQTMFASQVVEYQQGDQIGTDNTGADDNFVTDHPLYTAISDLADLTDEHPALRDGAQQVRYASDGPGLFAFSRIDRAPAARVRRRAQQQHRGRVGPDPDVRRSAARSGRCTATARPPCRRTRVEPARRAGARPLDGRLRVEDPDPAVARRLRTSPSPSRSRPRSRRAGCTCARTCTAPPSTR